MNRANLDLLDKKVSVGLRPGLAMFNNSNKRMPVVAKHDHTITVTNEAENWMKKNLGLTLDGGLPSEIRDKASKKMKRTYSARPGFRSTQSEHHFKSTNNDDLERDIPDTFGAQPPNLNKDFKIRPSSKGRRPMSAYSGTSGRSRASLKSAASEVQKITRATALGYCSRIATKAVLDNVKNSKFSARDKLSPSELQSILLNSGIKIDIATMRGLLYHMNFTAHGKSCSILDLIRRCKQWNAASQSAGQIDFTTREESTPLETVPELIGKVKD